MEIKDNDIYEGLEELNELMDEYRYEIVNSVSKVSRSVDEVLNEVENINITLGKITNNIEFIINRVNDLWLSNNSRIRRRERTIEVFQTIVVVILLIPFLVGFYTIFSHIIGKL